MGNIAEENVYGYGNGGYLSLLTLGDTKINQQR